MPDVDRKEKKRRLYAFKCCTLPKKVLTNYPEVAEVVADIRELFMMRDILAIKPTGLYDDLNCNDNKKKAISTVYAGLLPHQIETVRS